MQSIRRFYRLIRLGIYIGKAKYNARKNYRNKRSKHMKKKILVTFLFSTALIGIVGCGKAKNLSADEIINQLEDAEYPIDNVISYTEADDPNELLGRPGQYIQKVNFADMRLEQDDTSDPVGGSIEIFENQKDCSERQEYLQEVGTSMPEFVEYNYQFDNILIRVSKELEPDQAEDYKNAMDAIVNNEDLGIFSFEDSELTRICVRFNRNLSLDEQKNINSTIQSLSGIVDFNYKDQEALTDEYISSYYADSDEELREIVKKSALETGMFNPMYDLTVISGCTETVKNKMQEISGVERVDTYKFESENLETPLIE